MKVKCEGSDNPPCVRCNKAGKECQFIVISKSRNTKSLALDEDIKIPKRDLRGTIKIFCEKLLQNIPVLDIDDIQDANHLIDTNIPLVYCICYVTARFLSRGEHLREMLMPKILQILKGGLHQNNEMSALKALIILYRYADCLAPSPDDAEEL